LRWFFDNNYQESLQTYIHVHKQSSLKETRIQAHR